jgi:hypothetical protein
MKEIGQDANILGYLGACVSPMPHEHASTLFLVLKVQYPRVVAPGDFRVPCWHEWLRPCSSSAAALPRSRKLRPAGGGTRIAEPNTRRGNPWSLGSGADLATLIVQDSRLTSPGTRACFVSPPGVMTRGERHVATAPACRRRQNINQYIAYETTPAYM